MFSFFFFFVALFHLLLQIYYLTSTQTIIDVNTWSIISYESFSLKVSFKIDKLTIIMLFVVIFISLFVCLFSIWYMRNDPNHLKFLNYLNYFMFFMILLVTGNSLLTVFIGWEGIGLFSYLLINFWNDRLNANRSAFKAIIINKIGDSFIFLLMAIYCDTFETINISGVKSNLFFFLNSGIIILNIDILFIICVSLFIAAIAKSAQFFLHVWLPDAMEGPTPVSALLHAATMVTAGAYLIIKFNWIYLLNDDILSVMLIIGLLTNFISSFICMFQSDIKKVIAYSTASQMGLIISAIGMYKPILAFFHMFNHAFFKALLFILAGVVIHWLQNKQDLRFISNINGEKFMVYSGIIISLLTLVGFPYLSGFYSKEVIIQISFINIRIFSILIPVFLLFSIITTAYYSIRLLYYACMFENNNENCFDYLIAKSKKDLSFIITEFVVAVLLFFSIFIGLIANIIFLYEDLFFNISVSKYFIVEKLKDVQNLEYVNWLLPIFELVMGYFFVYYHVKLQTIFFFNKYNYFIENIFFKKFHFDILYFYATKILLATRGTAKNDKGLNENYYIFYIKTKIKAYKLMIKYIISNKILLATVITLLIIDIIFLIFLTKYFIAAIISIPIISTLNKKIESIKRNRKKKKIEKMFREMDKKTDKKTDKKIDKNG